MSLEHRCCKALPIAIMYSILVYGARTGQGRGLGRCDGILLTELTDLFPAVVRILGREEMQNISRDSRYCCQDCQTIDPVQKKKVLASLTETPPHLLFDQANKIQALDYHDARLTRSTAAGTQLAVALLFCNLTLTCSLSRTDQDHEHQAP